MIHLWSADSVLRIWYSLFLFHTTAAESGLCSGILTLYLTPSNLHVKKSLMLLIFLFLLYYSVKMYSE